ncbi:TetR/AcrR family transcriptional regulator [Erwinia sp. SLM-02]|uniref:TetR/AcrR family transcriptional regulator n=1 Tax=Erwinia sp. SLM-02 TaxID=3020057 RepID=UPI0028D2FFE2|nr:TetR/AcrR family transcriptional regulator [uncultured Erwinia sp.]
MTARRRLSKEERFAQLIAVAWQLIASEGTDALTMGHLADAAGITKPTVYEHFGSRQGLLAALYQDFESRQNKVIDDAVAAAEPVLNEKARIIAASYVNCVLTEGREIPDVLAALSGSPELAELRKQCQKSYLKKCRGILGMFSGPRGLSDAALWAMLGAADSLSAMAVSGEIQQQQAVDELYQVIVAMVERSR